MLPPNSYEAIGWLVVGLASLCVAVNQIDDFFERRKPRVGFPPVEQLENSQHALAERVEHLEDDISDLRHEMREDREAQSKSASIREYDKNTLRWNLLFASKASRAFVASTRSLSSKLMISQPGSPSKSTS